ncbi:peroxiredoxin family protein [Haloferula rosea]|uniref:Peroxiredoxin family protein n=1 Tax=Haloferula rosea TaxID=490093 RepID=A0A934VFQ5_9BACT|nr:peroxiredoxin family protein [Haloferula rosea]MBK1827237.1 peroxiredoxin family protein [Haloferula rosea]
MTHLFRKGSMLQVAALLSLVGSLAPAQDAQPTFKRYNLRCLAPLLESLDAEAPRTLEEALLAGPAGSVAPRVGEDVLGVGAVDFPVDAGHADVQAHFNRGVALLHALWYREAERSFRSVVHLDPDGPMGYWGLAMANELRPGRARVFAKAAVDRTNVNRPAMEQRWVGILGDYYEVSSNQTQADGRARSEARIRALEDLVIDFPESVEAKAFMVRQLVLDQYRAGVEITSRLGVESLLRELAEAAPGHPSRQYGAFLWLRERPDRGVPFARASVEQARGVAEVWRYAAEALSAAGRSAEALPLYENAVRVDLDYLSQNLLMPWEAQNFSGNYEAFVSTLIGMGRIEEAGAWAAALLELPRQSVGMPEYEGKDLNELGAELWIRALATAERWEELEVLLNSEKLRGAGEGYRVQAERMFWLGVCGLFSDGGEGAVEALADLNKLHRQALGDGVSNVVEQAIVSAGKSLRTCQGLFGEDEPDGVGIDFEDPWISGSLLGSIHRKVGLKREALELARVAVERHPDHVLPVATFISLAYDAGRKRDAFLRFSRPFRILAGQADAGLPALEGLDAAASEMQLPEPWTLSAKPAAEGTEVDADRGKAWLQPMAPDFVLPDALGRSHSLEGFRGKPVLINFFLGVQCGYCLEQLSVFKPHLGAFREAGIEFVAVSSDTAEVLQGVIELTPGETYREDGAFPFLVLADPALKTFREYGAFDDFEGGPLHATVLLDGEGRLIWADRGHAPFKRPEILLAEAERLIGVSDAVK